MIEKTICIIKPDVTGTKRLGQAISFIETRFKILHLTYEWRMDTFWENFYSGIKDEWYFKRNVEFMASGPVCAMVLQGEDAISRLRAELGSTDPRNAAEGTLRHWLGGELPCNAAHGSDSKESAKREGLLLFPFFDMR